MRKIIRNVWLVAKEVAETDGKVGGIDSLIGSSSRPSSLVEMTGKSLKLTSKGKWATEAKSTTENVSLSFYDSCIIH